MKLRTFIRAVCATGSVLIATTSTYAIKINIPDQYKERIEELRAREQAELERAFEADRTDLGESAGVPEGEKIEINPVIPEEALDLGEEETAEIGDFILESVDEATETAAAFEGELPVGEGLVSGQVLDRETQAPVAGVAILLEGTTIGTITGSDGRYSLGPAPAGTYTLTFIKTGYIESNVTEFSVLEEEVSVFPFALPPRPVEMSDEVYELQDFTVTAAQATELMAKLDLRLSSDSLLNVLSSEDFAKLAASDVAEAVSKISGASLSDGKYVVIRGLNDRYNTTLINGVVLPSPDPDRKAVALDIFPTSLFDNIIARKTFTADMPGESSGGSIELVTKSIPDEPFVKFSFGLGGQITSSETETFLSDPEQVSLGEWLAGDDNRGFSLTPGT
ncbi:MAG: carboxypeptidase-like regulatory domain-containing protein, partial [Verrucomicrobiota bacterium]